MADNTIIPEQQSGGSSDTASSFTASSAEKALSFFKLVKQRLLDVNQWKEIAVMPSAEFSLCDQYGRKVNRVVKEGDHFRISIPGPGNEEGDGDDWVRVESVDEKYADTKESVIITVRPCANPAHPADTAHFFTDEATSSFVAERNENVITASVHGRNEKPNTDVETVTGKLRNALVANAAINLFSKMQWRSLVSGMIKEQH